MNSKKGFTLVELLAVIAILAIILAITVPGIYGIIKSSTKKAFEIDAKMLLKSIDYKKMKDAKFDETILNEENIYDALGVSNAHYSKLSVTWMNDVLIV